MARSSTTFKRGHKATGGRPKGSLNRSTIDVREFALSFIGDPEYQSRLLRRIIAGKAPQVEMLLFKYAYGQPGERHEVNADARVAGSNGPELKGSAGVNEDHSERNLRIHGGVVTQEGAERIRGLMAGIIEYANKKGANAEPAGELPPGSATPPGAPA